MPPPAKGDHCHFNYIFYLLRATTFSWNSLMVAYIGSTAIGFQWANLKYG